MTEDDGDTKDLTSALTDRQLLEMIVRDVRGLDARVAQLESRTNPLPSNYDTRFAAVEQGIEDTQGLIGDIERVLTAFKSETKRQFEQLNNTVRLINNKLEELNTNAFDARAVERDLTARIEQLEQRTN
jgi:hypothetical protein